MGKLKTNMAAGSLFTRKLASSLGFLARSQSAKFHLSSNYGALKSSDGRFQVTLLPGDGVGPELMDSVQAVLKTVGAPIDFDQLHLSEVQHRTSATLDQFVRSINRNQVAIKGVISIPDTAYTGELQNLNQHFRNGLDIYANVIRVKSLPGVQSKHKDLDFVIIREQTEGEYTALEHESIKGVVECLKVVTAEKSRRIAKFAFDYATKHGRKKVTAVHKANIMKLGDGLFLRCCQEIAEYYPQIQFETMTVDNTTMQLVSNPQQFDVMVMPNLYGNIMQNLAAGLVGGAGLVAGASYSVDLAIFEPGAKHTFDSAVGKNSANPTAMLLSSVKLLDHLSLETEADRIRKAIHKVLNEGQTKTRDLGGFASTQQFTAAVINNIK